MKYKLVVPISLIILILFFLLIVIFISNCNNKEDNKIQGVYHTDKWDNYKNGGTIVLNDDGTCTFPGYQTDCKWHQNEDKIIFTVDMTPVDPEEYCDAYDTNTGKLVKTKCDYTKQYEAIITSKGLTINNAFFEKK